ncbi:MAG TPA: tetratricopeptide repeat protein, partial [Gemmataceae bacterium]|nr:tetratricopeptide repeat protein [Gemmataceae bacterium]
MCRSEGDTIIQLQEALRCSPNDPDAYYNLAQALARQSRRDEAILCCRQALSLNPELADAHKLLGDVLRQCSNVRGTALDEAASSYRSAIRIRPADAEAHKKLGSTLKAMGLLDEAFAAFRRACKLHPESAQHHSSLVYSLHFHPGYDAEALAQEHERWNRRHAEPLAKLIRPHPNDPDPKRRLRIGYVSQYFQNHPVGRFLLPLLEAHDHGGFEIFCYASFTRPDDLTARLRTHADHWCHTEGWTDEKLADVIRQDRIDVLVDLDMHMFGNRLLTFARKPAPVQVTYLAYCSTTGLRAMDYRLTDPFLDPPGQPTCYAEESVWLPETYWCYRPPVELPPPGPPPAAAS